VVGIGVDQLSAMPLPLGAASAPGMKALLEKRITALNRWPGRANVPTRKILGQSGIDLERRLDAAMRLGVGGAVDQAFSPAG